ncbi:MAG: hypothetical protein ACLP05_08835 [Candidatus Kryptoniota bacterium]
MRIVTDFDILNEENPLKDIFEELGGAWSSIESDWKIVKTQIEQKRPELESKELKAEIDKVFGSTEERMFSRAKVSEVQKILRKASPWAHAKEVGKPFIPSGDATKAFERIQKQLKAVGLFIVEVGELEGFDRSVGNHGPKWINEVLTKDLKTDAELQTARQFVKEVTA